MISGYVIAVGILSFLMSFAIGANDAANALATSYGSKALKLWQIVVLGAIFEFIGAFFCSGHVAGHLVSGIVEGTDTLEDDVINQMMLGTSISSFLFIMASSVFGVPISGTHTIVGSIIGAGMAVFGASSINWLKLGTIVISWFVAPLVSIILCAIFFIAVTTLTLDKTRNSFNARLIWLTLISGFACMLICLMIMGLVREKDAPYTTVQLICFLLSPIAGIIITRISLMILMRHIQKKGEAEQPAQNDMENEQQEAVIGQLYRVLMVVAAMLVCLGHGANDVANSISPLLVALESEGDNIQIAYIIGSVGIALGLLILGYRVMETVGTKVVKLDFAKGFTAQFATALSVNLGTIAGVPLSTTHCMVGALMGLALAQKLKVVQNVYPVEEKAESPQKTADEVKEAAKVAPEPAEADEESGVKPEEAPKQDEAPKQEGQQAAEKAEAADEQKPSKDARKGKVICKILVWWLATVPVALLCSYGVTQLLRHI